MRVRGRGCAVRAAVLTEHGGLESEQTEHTLTLADRTVQSGRTLQAAGLRTDGTAARKVSKAESNRALAGTRADNTSENCPLSERAEQSAADSVLSPVLSTKMEQYGTICWQFSKLNDIHLT